MGDESWIRVARSRRVTGVPFTPVPRGERTVLLTRLADGRVVAFDSACPHTGQPLHRGALVDGCIECPFHFYRYEATTGRNVFPDLDATDTPLTTYAVRERDGWVELGPPRQSS